MGRSDRYLEIYNLHTSKATTTSSIYLVLFMKQVLVIAIEVVSNKYIVGKNVLETTLRRIHDII